MKTMVRVGAVMWMALVVGCSAAEGADEGGTTDDGKSNEVNASKPKGAPAGSFSIEAKLKPVISKLLAEVPDLVIFAPSELPTDEVFLSGSASKQDGHHNNYSINFDFAENCSGSGACSMGSIASTQEKVPFKPNDEVDGTKVEFQEMTCGASCAPPSMTWRFEVETYTVFWKGASRDQLKGLVRSAIKAGMRR